MDGMSSNYLSAEILMDFSKSIEFVEKYETAIDGLNASVGTLEGRLSALRDNIATMSEAKGNNLRSNIEAQLKNAILQNGVVISSVGDKPFRIKADVMRQINGQIENELNRTLAEQAENIKMKIDPNYKKVLTTTISSEHFDKFNDEVAKIIKNQMQAIGRQLKSMELQGLTAEDLAGQNINIGKQLVQSLIAQVKKQIKPLIANPVVVTEGLELKIPAKDAQVLANKITRQIVNALGNGTMAHLVIPQAQFDAIHNTISKMIMNQIGTLNQNLGKVNLAALDRPVNELSKTTQKIIADRLNMDVEALRKTNMRVTNGQIATIQVEQAFKKLEDQFNRKVDLISNEYAKEVVAAIKGVQFEVQPSITHELNSDLKKINDALVKKVRQQVQVQVQHILAEIEAAGVAPGKLGNVKGLNTFGSNPALLNQRPNGGRTTVNNNTNIVHNYAQQNLGNSSGILDGARTTGMDPYARRDNYFNSFGLEGALVNTLRHVLAGSMVGAPIMAIYEAMETFKDTQLEMLKVYQNYFMQTYTKQGADAVDSEQIKAQAEELNNTLKDMAIFYGIDYTQMSELGAIASRLTDDPEESVFFSNAAAQILRLDNSGDLVEDIAPGLEAIMLQFGMSVWELNKVVATFAVATNVTKASTDELMDGLSRSGASFAGANVSMEHATLMLAGALQTTGLSGSDLGNMFKTLNQRLAMPSVQEKLSELGINVYDENGQRTEGIDLYRDLANIIANPNTSDVVKDDILGSVAGMYQVGKLRAFIGSMNTIEGPVDSEYIQDDDGKLYDPFNINDYLDDVDFSTQQKMEEAMNMVYALLQESLDNPAIAMERADVAVNVALTSILEEMAPAIEDLSDVIVNVSGAIRDNSDKVAQLTAMLLQTAVGFGAYTGAKWALNKGGLGAYQENYRMQEKIYGGRLDTTPSTARPLLDMLDDDLDILRDRNKNTTKMFEMAQASPAIAGVLGTLANMSNEDVQRTLDYNNDVRGGKRIQNFAELSTLLEEAKDYFTGDMDDDERRIRGRQNVGNLINRTQDIGIFAGTFAEALRDFDIMTASPESRKMFDSMARMNDVAMNDFEMFLAQDSVRNGTRINNMDDLALVHGRYRDVQATRTDHRIHNDVNANRLNRRFGNLQDDINAPILGGFNLRGVGNNILDGSRSIGRSLASLGKTFAKFAGQAALLMQLGDVLIEWFQRATMTDTQEKVYDISKEKSFLDSIYDFQAKGAYGQAENPLDFVWNALLKPVGWISDSILDLIPGIDRKGVDDVPEYAAKMNEALKELYGTTNIAKIKEETGLSDNEIKAAIAKETGIADELKEAEKAKFEEDYFKFMEDQQIQLQRQSEAELAREAYNKGMLQSNPNEIHVSELVDMLNKELEKLGKEANIAELDAMLDGYKTSSDEYFAVLESNLQKQIDLYNQYLSQFDEHIAELQKKISEMEKSGEDETMGDAYEKYKQELKDTQEKRQEFLDEIEEQMKEAEVEKIRTQYNRGKQRVTNRLNDYEYGNFFDEYYRDMGTVEGSFDEAEWSRQLIEKKKAQAREIIDMYKGLADVDLDDETKELIRDKERELAELNQAYYQTFLESMGRFQTAIDRTSSETRNELLRAQVASGITDSNDPALKNIRNSLLSRNLEEINKQYTSALAEYNAIGSDADPDYRDQMYDKLLDLERQSLEVQLEQLDEMKMQRGTFNLPEGLTVMSQLDYMMGQGTHTQYTLQQGETYVTVVLPNVTGSTNQNTLNNIGKSLGSGISNGRINSYRTQISGNPNGYRVLM